MADLRKLNISAEELSKAINPFHINVCDIDRDRIIEAYPSLVVENIMSEFNFQTNKYIAKQLIAFNIDKDVLIKQTQEIQRLNNKIAEVQEYVEQAYNKAIDDFAENISLKISKSIIWGMLVNSHKDNSFNDTSDKIVDYVINTANEIAEQLKAGGND